MKYLIWNADRNGYWQYGSVYGSVDKATRFARADLTADFLHFGDEVRILRDDGKIERMREDEEPEL